MKITRTVGHKRDGTPIKKQFYGKTKRECQKKYEKWLSEDHTMLSVEERAEAFIAKFENDSHYSVGTRRLYVTSYNTYIKGNVATPQKVYDAIKTQGALDTARKIMKLIYEDLGEPLNVVIPDKPYEPPKEIVIREQEEIDIIESKMRDHPLFLAIEISLYAGLRISEVLGLKYDDLRDGKVRVNKQYCRGNLAPPKANSVRSIPMHPKIATALEEHKKRHTHGEYVFLTSTGNLYDYHNVVRSLQRAYKKCGVPTKKFHAYRATFCTNLCRNGVRIEVASKLMGHKSIEVTAKYYSFVGESDYVDAINNL